MPVHDWTRVEAGIFHHFHNGWIYELANALNGGLLPSGYYALGEQHAGRPIADMLTLHSQPPSVEPPPSGGIAVAEVPPRVRHRLAVSATYRSRRRTLAVRHITGHRIVALLEVVSPANKDRASHVLELARKVEDALYHGIHVLLVDLFNPGPHDPHGMHGQVWQMLDEDAKPYDPPKGEPVTLASYVADSLTEALLEHVAFDQPLPDMPLYFRSDRYVNVPLEQTYQAAYQSVPAVWRAVLERRSPSAQA
jgi:hypothetical protein